MKSTPEYLCVIKKPARQTKLRSKTVKVPVRVIEVEGFSRNPDGTDVPNGINFKVLVPR